MGTPYPARYIQRVIQRAKNFAIFVPKDLPLLLSWVHQYDYHKRQKDYKNDRCCFGMERKMKKFL